MKKQTLLLLNLCLFCVIIITSCGNDKPKTYDESQYVGIYTGQHALADSTSLRTILGDPTIDVFFDDSLTVTNGSNPTDGKLLAVSKYLNGKSIEIDITKTSANITPTSIGALSFGVVNLTNVKVSQGSNATFNNPITIVNTNLKATIDFGIIAGIPLNINGIFTKQ